MNWNQVVTLRSLPPARVEPARREPEPLAPSALDSLVRLAAAAAGDEAERALMDAMIALGTQADAFSPLLECLVARAHELDKLKQLAGQDELTSVANRRAFNDALHREASRCKRAGSSLAVLYVDMDGLKAINDRFGHHAGDQAIASVAQSCIEMLRGSDLVARLGGDEFAVLLPDVDQEGAMIVRDRLRERIERATICGERLRTSIGLAVMGGDQLNGDQLVALADAELYRDKQERKSLVSLEAA